jgi:ABC-type multidrug transport system ATPase subunit
LSQAFLSLALGQAAPSWGEIRWFGALRPGPTELWENCAFSRRLGYVPKNGRLFSGRSLLENLGLYFEYALGHDRETARNESRLWLEKLGLANQAETLGEKMPEDKLPLALFALNVAKKPDLFILDRPRRRFERDFPVVWSSLLEQKAARNLAVLIFEPSQGTWRPEVEAKTLTLWSPSAS